MEQIQLTQNQVTTVDDEDYEWLNQSKWTARFDKNSNSYYAYRMLYFGRINGKEIRKMQQMHRAIMERILEDEGRFEELKQFRENPMENMVDHINHNTLQNTRNNLRKVSTRQNQQNLKIKGTSKYPGVSWDKNRKKWRAQIKINKKSNHLDFFNTELRAFAVYKQAVKKFTGENVLLNDKW